MIVIIISQAIFILRECETLLSPLNLHEMASVFDSVSAHFTYLIVVGETTNSLI